MKAGEYMEVNGEPIAKDKAMELIRILCQSAWNLAGEFHEWDRSPKFRANWPSAEAFAYANWRHFIEAAREVIASKLGDPNVDEYTKHRMFLAICLYDQVAKVSPNFEGIQLAPGTQQFEGDKRQNREITEQYGKRSDTFRDLLMASTRYH